MFRIIVTIGLLQILTILVQVVRAKVISVDLGPAGLGLVGLTDQLIILVGMVCALSLPTVAVRVMSRSYGRPEFARQYAAFLQAIVAASVIGCGALGVVLLSRPDLFGTTVEEYSTEFGVALVNAPLFAVGLFLPNVLAAHMRPVGAAALSFAIAAIATVAAGIGLLWGGVREIYIAQAIVTAVLLAWTLIYFKRKLHLPLLDRDANLIAEVRARPDIIPTAIAFYASLVGTAFSLLVVRYVTAHSLGIETGGWLQAILSMVLAVGAVMIAMAARYLGPQLNRPSTIAEKFATFDMFRRRQLMLLVAMSVPLVLFAKLALIVLFSSKFTIAAAWLPAFLVWQLVIIQTNVQMQLLFALDELWIVTIKSIAGCIASTVLCAALIPHFGVNGAAAAMLVGAILAFALGAERLHRRGYAMTGSSILLVGYAVAALMIAPYLTQNSALDSIPIRIVACLALIAGLWLFLTPEEKASVRHFGRLPTAPAG
jgi:O-antigen/teichoic acid export membrane protein